MRRWFSEMATVYLIIFAFMHDIVDFGRVGINSALDVFQNGIVFPARFPQFVTDIAVLIRHVITIVMIG